MVATTETFHNVLQVIQTSCLNYRIELSPFSAIIHLKNSSIKDKNGNPIKDSHPMIDNQVAKMKLENDELSRKISQQDKTIQILQAKSANALDESKQIYEVKENPEVKLYQTPCFSFPPPGYPIPQQCPQVKVPPHSETEYSELYRDYRELEHEFDNLESSKISLKKDLELKSKTAEDVEKEIVELEKDLLAFKTDNNLLRENIKDLEFDTKKIKGDYLELSKKVASQYNEYQEKIKELSVEKTVIDERNLKKEEKRAKKKTKREQMARDSEVVTDVEFRSGEREENDGVNFTCTLCAKYCDITELSAKSVPEEHDACKACNTEDTCSTVPINIAISKPAVDEPNKVKDIVNVVHNFWNGDLYVNKRLAIDYINMCQYSNHDCDECNYISVINEGVAPGGTGGWSMQFCKKFNFKLGDPFKEPPYILGSLPPT